MLKSEAQTLVGTRVSAWTAANGTYSGTLVEVLSEKGRPWRAKVLIDGVLAVATHFEIGKGAMRRGFRPGEEIEVGGSSISPCSTAGPSYAAALEAEIEKLTGWVERDPASRYAGLHQQSAAALREILRREQARLETGVWPTNGQVFNSTSQPA